MKPLPASRPSYPPNPTNQAQSRVVLLALAGFVLGLAIATLGYYRAAHRLVPPPDQAPSLSEGTRAILQQLHAPVAIHFYSLLDTQTVAAPTLAFAERVGRLVSEYERAGGGKVKAVRSTDASDAGISAATADGIAAFNRDRGAVSYFGIAVASGDRQESLPQLSPDWEPALEADITRVIARVAAAAAPTTPAVAEGPDVNAGAIQEVKQLIPDVAAVSLEDGSRILREDALKQFQAAAVEMQRQIQEAQEQLVRAQNGGSAADQQAALRNLQQLQASQAEKLKEITARSQAQVDALRKLKAAAP
jgi:hypothetical protein